MRANNKLYEAAKAVVDIFDRQEARELRHTALLRDAANCARAGNTKRAEMFRRQVDNEKREVFVYEDALKNLRKAVLRYGK